MTTLAILGKLVALVFKVNQSPILLIALQNDTATFTAITAIRTTESDELLATEVTGTCSSMTRTSKNLYIIYKV
jgi:hypothetical protein